MLKLWSVLIKKYIYLFTFTHEIVTWNSKLYVGTISVEQRNV